MPVVMWRAALSVCLLAAGACEKRAIELGFWIEPQTYESPRIGEPITAAEYDTIDAVARLEITEAFKDYELTLTSNHSARFKVQVVAGLKDMRHLRRSSTYAGESRAVAGFGGSGSVNFEFVANGAMVFSPEDAGRATVIEALGRGIGRVAIHEFLHQLLPKSPIDSGTDVRSYEGNTAAMTHGYFGGLHWDIARPWLDARLKRRAVVASNDR